MARVEQLLLRTSGKSDLGRLNLVRSPSASPVTTLLARPMLSALGIPGGNVPLGDLALVRTGFLKSYHLPGGWGFDVALTLAAVGQGHEPVEVATPEVRHRIKPLHEYEVMAEEIARAIARGRGLANWDHADCVNAVADAQMHGHESRRLSPL